MNKTLLAVAIAGASLMAGNAQAALLGTNDAFLQVWDVTNKTTYDLNLAAVNSALTDANLLTSGNVTVDLSQDATWNTFVSTLDKANAVWGVVAFGSQGSTSGQFEITTGNPNTTNLFSTLSTFNSSLTAVKGQYANINTSLTASSNSAVVSDASPLAGSFQVASGSTLDNIWATASAAKGSATFGSTVSFEAISGVNVKTGLTNKFTETNIVPGTFTLSGNTLTFTSAAAPSSVPLPSAVWMFGAGLMGFLGLNRRKAAV